MKRGRCKGDGNKVSVHVDTVAVDVTRDVSTLQWHRHCKGDSKPPVKFRINTVDVNLTVVPIAVLTARIMPENEKGEIIGAEKAKGKND